MNGLEQQLVQAEEGKKSQSSAQDEAEMVSHDANQLIMPLDGMHTSCTNTLVNLI